MRIRGFLSVLGLGMLACTAGWAQGPGPVTPATPKPLTLQEAIAIAMANQIDIKVGQNNVTIARGRLTQARSDYFPSVTVQNNTFRTGSGRGVLRTTNTGTALTVNQNFFDAGLREANVRGTRYGVTGTRATLARTTQRVQFDVTADYYNVLRSRHLAEVAESNVKYNEAFRQLIQARIDVGDAAQVDVLPVEAQLASARVDLVAAQNNVRTAAIQLQNTMGISPQPGFDVVDVTATPQAQLKPMDDYIRSAVAVRPDVAAAEAGLGAAKADVRATRINLFPRPVISGNYQKGFGTNIGSSHEIVGSIVFDVFNGGANRAAYRSAKASRQTASDQSQQVVKDIQSDVGQAYLNLTSAGERVTASQVGLDAAVKNYEVQEAKYKQGLAIPLDLLNAELQRVTAQTNEVQARYDYLTAMAQMEFAVGTPGGLNAK